MKTAAQKDVNLRCYRNRILFGDEQDKRLPPGNTFTVRVLEPEIWF